MKCFLHGVLLFALVLPAACMSNHTERAADVNPQGWLPGDTVWVAYTNSDTVSFRDISILVRLTAGTAADTLDLSVCTITPDSVKFCEKASFNITPATAAGKDFLETTVPYRVRCTLAKEGEYRFGFVPAKQYKGITAIGIRLD